MDRGSFWKGRRVFLTGCAGLLGSWLTRALVDAGAEVVGLVHGVQPAGHSSHADRHRSIIQVRGEVTDYPLLERLLNEYEIDTVFHLAGQSIVGAGDRAPLDTLEINVRGTWLVLEACRRVKTVGRVAVASSDKAYGDQEPLPYTEDLPLLGRQPYGVSKACADLIATAFARTYDLPVVVTRCSNLYGGGDLNWERIVPGTVRRVLRGERPVIRSDGLPLRDYLYVEDAVDGYLRLVEQLEAQSLRGQAFNFGTGDPKSAREMVEAIIALSDHPDLTPIILNQAGNEIRRQYMSSDKAQRVLGWQAHTALDEGLRRTLAWYRAFFAEATGSQALAAVETSGL